MDLAREGTPPGTRPGEEPWGVNVGIYGIHGVSACFARVIH